MTPRELRSLCSTWQARLRLLDWDVEIRFAGDGEINSFGRCTYLVTKKHAWIVVMTEEQRAKEILDEPIEQTVVHELLHLHYAAIDNEETRLTIEQAIHPIAIVLVHGS